MVLWLFWPPNGLGDQILPLSCTWLAKTFKMIPLACIFPCQKHLLIVTILTQGIVGQELATPPLSFSSCPSSNMGPACVRQAAVCFGTGRQIPWLSVNFNETCIKGHVDP